MKDLSTFETVKQALNQVVKESDINNGTQNVELVGHFYQQEYIFDKDKQDLQLELTRAVLASDISKIKQLQTDMEKLPKPKIVMEFKLLTVIPRLQGTKILSDGDKQYKISMENVGSLFIPEDAVHLGLIGYDETEEKARDAQGRETPIIKFVVQKGIIDVAAPIVDRFDKVIRPKRAYVTAISYGSMQLAGKLLNTERLSKRRRFGFDEQA